MSLPAPSSQFEYGNLEDEDGDVLSSLSGLLLLLRLPWRFVRISHALLNNVKNHHENLKSVKSATDLEKNLSNVVQSHFQTLEDHQFGQAELRKRDAEIEMLRAENERLHQQLGTAATGVPVEDGMSDALDRTLGVDVAVGSTQ